MKNHSYEKSSKIMILEDKILKNDSKYKKTRMKKSEIQNPNLK